MVAPWVILLHIVIPSGAPQLCSALRTPSSAFETVPPAQQREELLLAGAVPHRDILAASSLVHASLASRPSLEGIFFGDRLEGVLTDPNALLVGILVVLAAIFVAWTYGMSASTVLNEQAAVREQLLALEHNYISSLGEIEGKLQSMQECSALLAERNFEDKARSFRAFLHRLQLELSKDPGGGNQQPDQLLQPVQAFIGHWLDAFAQCTPRPRVKPLRIMANCEVAACNSTLDVAELLCQRLDGCQLNLLGKSLAKVKGLQGCKDLFAAASRDAKQERHHMACSWFHCGFCGIGFGERSSPKMDSKAWFPTCVCLGCCSVTLLSRKHATIMVGAVAGLVMLIVEACIGKPWSIAFLLAAELGFAAAAVRIEFVDSLAAAEERLVILRQAGAEMQEVREVLLDFHEHRQEVAELWQLHTEPRLELLTELFERVGEASPAQRLELIEAACHCLANAAQGLGPMEAWVCESRCSKGAREFASQQLRSCVDAVGAADPGAVATAVFVSLLHQPIFGLLVVRVQAASGLRNADFSVLGGNLSDPYAICRVGTQEQRTETVQDTLDPVWDAEPFVFKLRGKDRLEIVINDQDTAARHDCLGSVSLDPRKVLVSGTWQVQTETLQPVGRNPAQGELRFEVYLADSVQQMNWEAVKSSA